MLSSLAYFGLGIRFAPKHGALVGAAARCHYDDAHGIPIVRCAIHGMDGRFVFDSGSSESFLFRSSSMARRMRSRSVHRRFIDKGALAGSIQFARVHRCDLLNAIFGGFDLAIYDSPIGRFGVDGIIGRNLLGQLPIDADFPSKSLRFLARLPPGKRVRLESSSRGMTVPVSLGGRSGHFLLDTGASVSTTTLAPPHSASTTTRPFTSHGIDGIRSSNESTFYSATGLLGGTIAFGPATFRISDGASTLGYNALKNTRFLFWLHETNGFMASIDEEMVPSHPVGPDAMITLRP